MFSARVPRVDGGEPVGRRGASQRFLPRKARNESHEAGTPWIGTIVWTSSLSRSTVSYRFLASQHRAKSGGAFGGGTGGPNRGAPDALVEYASASMSHFCAGR